MIVVDASALVELITDEGGLADRVREALMDDGVWAAPEHAVVEVVSALRGLWLGGRCTDAELDARLALLAQIELVPFAVLPLLPAIRRLMSNATAYDGAYLALAESLDVPLVTVDADLSSVAGTSARVHTIARL